MDDATRRPSDDELTPNYSKATGASFDGAEPTTERDESSTVPTTDATSTAITNANADASAASGANANATAAPGTNAYATAACDAAKNAG